MLDPTLYPEIRQRAREYLIEYGPSKDPPEELTDLVLENLENRGQRIVRLLEAGDPAAWPELRGLVRSMGLGWGRFIPSSPLGFAAGWDGLWPKAHQATEREAESWIRNVAKFLEHVWQITGFSAASVIEASPLIAVEVVHALMNYSPLPQYEVDEAGDLVVGGITPTEACLKRHSLEGWDPEATSFVNFIAQAVKGALAPRKETAPAPARKATAKKPKKSFRLSAGGLVQALLWPYLQRIAHLRYEKVLFWVYRGARNHLALEGRPLELKTATTRGKVQSIKTVLIPCPSSKKAWRTVRMRIIIPAHFENGRFYPRRYWRCPTCSEKAAVAQSGIPGAKYFRATRTQVTCPHCDFDRKKTARASTVYLQIPEGETAYHSLRRDIEDLTQISDPQDVSPAASYWRVALCREVGRVMEHLSPVSREIFRMHFWEGLSYKQMGGRCGCSEKVIKSRFQRAVAEYRDACDIPFDHEI